MFNTEKYLEQLQRDAIFQQNLKQQRQQEETQRQHKLRTDAYDYVNSQLTQQQQLQNQPEVKPEDKQEGNGFLKETGLAALGGVRDGIQEMINSIEWLSNKFLNADGQVDFGDLPKVEENKSGLGKFSRMALAFMMGFIPFTGAVGKLGKLAEGSEYLMKLAKYEKLVSFAKNTAAGALTDMTMFPHEERLSNLIEQYPALQNPITGFLKAKPDDGEAEARLKNALEGMLAGSLIDGFVESLRFMRGKSLAHAEGKGEVADFIEKQIKELDNSVDTVIEASKKSSGEDVAVNTINEKLAAIKEEADKQRQTFNLKEKKQYAPDDYLSRSPEEQADIIQGAKTVDDATSVLEQAAKNNNEDTLSIAAKSAQEMPEDTVLVKSAVTGEHVNIAPPEYTPLHKYPYGVDEAIDVEDTVKAFKSASKEAVNPLEKAASEGKEVLKGKVASSNIYTPEMAKYLDEVVLHSSPTIGSGLAGGMVGVMSDIDQDKKITISDFAIGFLGGAGLYHLARVFRSKNPKLAFEELKTKQLSRLEAIENKITEQLDSGSYYGDLQKRLEQHKQAVIDLKNTINKTSSVEKLTQITKNRELKTQLESARQPLVKINDKQINNLVKHIQENGLDGNTFLESDVFNFDHLASSDDVKELISTTADIINDKIGKITGGVQTEAMTRKLADELGMTVDGLNKLFRNTVQGKGKLSARVMAARNILHASGEKMEQFARKLVENNGDVSASDIIAFRKQAAIHSGIVAQVKGIQTEIARSLQLFNYHTTKAASLDEIEEMLMSLGSAKKNVEAAKRFLSLSSERQRNMYARALSKNKPLNMLLEYYYNALLSSPATWIVNTVSNTLTVANYMLEKGLAVGYSKLAGRDTHQAGELKAMVYGLMNSIKDAFHYAGLAWKTGESHFDSFMKIEGKEYDAITAAAFNLSDDSFLGRLVNSLGNIVRIPSKILTSTDDFFKVINSRLSLHEQSFKQAMEIATNEGLEGKALQNRVSELITEMVNNPSEEMFKKSIEVARYNTFTNSLGTAGKGVQMAINSIPVMRFIVPFVRTPTNIMKYIGERTFLSNTLLKALKDPDPYIRDAAKAKLTVGSGLFAIGGLLAANGVLTGGGPKNNAHLRQAGWQPYSFKVGNKYYGFNRVDPFGAFLGLAADAYEILQHTDDEETAGKVASMAVAAISKNIVSKTYLKGISDLIEVINDPDRYGENWVQNMGATFVVPSILKTTSKQIDPTIRETQTFFDEVKSRIPGLSDTLEPRRDIFGEKMTYEGTAFSPFYKSTEKDDPVRQTLADLGINLNSIYSRSWKVNGGVKLTSEQHNRFMELFGKPFYKDMKKLINSKIFKRASEGTGDNYGGKQYMIKRLLRKHKLRAKQELYKEFPEVLQQVRNKRQEKLEALKAPSQ